ncbi:MAG: hypothetical protein WC330_07830, partial [Candidatus Omnitrophota bacterium]
MEKPVIEADFTRNGTQLLLVKGDIFPANEEVSIPSADASRKTVEISKRAVVFVTSVNSGINYYPKNPKFEQEGKDPGPIVAHFGTFGGDHNWGYPLDHSKFIMYFEPGGRLVDGNGGKLLMSADIAPTAMGEAGDRLASERVLTIDGKEQKVPYTLDVTMRGYMKPSATLDSWDSFLYKKGDGLVSSVKDVDGRLWEPRINADGKVIYYSIASVNDWHPIFEKGAYMGSGPVLKSTTYDDGKKDNTIPFVSIDERRITHDIVNRIGEDGRPLQEALSIVVDKYKSAEAKKAEFKASEAVKSVVPENAEKHYSQSAWITSLAKNDSNGMPSWDMGVQGKHLLVYKGYSNDGIMLQPTFGSKQSELYLGNFNVTSVLEQNLAPVTHPSTNTVFFFYENRPVNGQQNFVRVLPGKSNSGNESGLYTPEEFKAAYPAERTELRGTVVPGTAMAGPSYRETVKDANRVEIVSEGNGSEGTRYWFVSFNE